MARVGPLDPFSDVEVATIEAALSFAIADLTTEGDPDEVDAEAFTNYGMLLARFRDARHSRGWWWPDERVQSVAGIRPPSATDP